MKNLKFKPLNLLYLVLVAVFISCNTPEQNPSEKKYNNLGTLLNECEGYAVVITMGSNDGYSKAHRHWIVIVDGAGKLYTYQGTNYDVSKGDTLIVKP